LFAFVCLCLFALAACCAAQRLFYSYFFLFFVLWRIGGFGLREILTGSLQRVSNSLSAACFSLERVFHYLWFAIVIFVVVLRLLFWWNGFGLLLAGVAWFVCFIVLLCSLDVLAFVGGAGRGSDDMCVWWCMHASVCLCARGCVYPGAYFLFVCVFFGAFCMCVLGCCWAFVLRVGCVCRMCYSSWCDEFMSEVLCVGQCVVLLYSFWP